MSFCPRKLANKLTWMNFKMYRIELRFKPCFECTSIKAFSLIALGKWIFTFYLHIFRMLFIWFFPRMYWVLPFILTCAFPLLGRHMADMKSVTNVCVCVCMQGENRPSWNVWMARKLAVFSKKEESDKKEEVEGVLTRAACQV